MSDLLALAERCEAATGPDRELDLHIRSYIREGTIIPEERLGSFRAGFEPMESVWPKYTSSLDAAMTLVPEGCVFNVMTDYALPGRARVWDGERTHRADGETPALALTAACLRARHALTSPTD